jgi:nitrous oxide reductase accessory protein NosL
MLRVIFTSLAILFAGCGQAPKETAATIPAAIAPHASAHCGQTVLEIPFPQPTALLITQAGETRLENGTHDFGDCAFEVRAGRVFDL